VVPAAGPELSDLLVASLTGEELAVALDWSGAPLSGSMTGDDIAAAVAAGVTVLGPKTVRRMAGDATNLAVERVQGRITAARYEAAMRELVTGYPRYELALELGWLTEERYASASTPAAAAAVAA
jgi:hypothetical protein